MRDISEQSTPINILSGCCVGAILSAHCDSISSLSCVCVLWVIHLVPGTFQLTNGGVVKLLECCPKLTYLDLQANSRMDGSALKAMVDSQRPKSGLLKGLSLVKKASLILS